MKYKVNDNAKGVDISVDDLSDNKESFLEAFEECQQGRCSCPTQEYKKMESLVIDHDDQGIQLHLKSKQGSTIDKSEIEKCLEYTSKRINNKT